MRFKQGQSFLFLLIACFMITCALILFQDGPAGSVPTSGPDPDPATDDSLSLYISADKQVITYPEDLNPGDFIIVEASPVPAQAEVEFDFDFPGTVSNHYRVGNLLYALIGGRYEADPGNYNITIRSRNPGSVNMTFETTVSLEEKDFQTSRFSMPARVTEGWTAERLAEDREKIKEARSTSKAHPLWTGSFVLPVEGRVTSEYGAIRYINNNPPRRHSGIDIAEDTGTPVAATNSGIIRLADNLLSGGKTVIIDHGIGLSSTYMHLDSIAVEEGQSVEPGEIIGTLGMTGYATGPHLHWEVNLGDTPINPDQLLENDLLWIAPAYVEQKLSALK